MLIVKIVISSFRNLLPLIFEIFDVYNIRMIPFLGDQDENMEKNEYSTFIYKRVHVIPQILHTWKNIANSILFMHCHFVCPFHLLLLPTISIFKIKIMYL